MKGAGKGFVTVLSETHRYNTAQIESFDLVVVRRERKLEE